MKDVAKTMLFASITVSAITLFGADAVDAAVVEGTFTAVVTAASDPGQASFGRDPADWVGRNVQGTFSYDIDTPDT